MPLSEMTWSEVQEKGYLIFDFGVYDVSKYNDHHRGGPFLRELAGKDVTFQLWNAHRTNASFALVLKKLKVGSIAKSELPKEDQDLHALFEEFESQGLFDYKWKWLGLDFIKLTVPFLLALWLRQYSELLAVLLLSVQVLLACWWVHDVSHNSVFKSEAHSRFFSGLASIIFTGTYAVDYHYIIHRMHHGFANVLKLDGAISTAGITWHPSQESKLSKRLQPFRKLLWFGPILSLIVPFLLVLNLVMGLNRKKAWTIFALVLRWWFFFELVFPHHAMLAILPVWIGSYALGWISSLNHFHMHITEKLNPTFLRAVASTTQNMKDRSWLWTEVTGGLNFHIEHHLFASMPRHHYPEIAPRVELLFKRHAIPYQSCSKSEAFRNFNRAIGNAPLATRPA
jgi:fatty acid desaturase